MNPRVFKYNPALLSEEELQAYFVVRQTDLEQILRVIRDNISDDENPNQHVLVIGPRGSGKTTLVLRTAMEIRQDSEMNEVWYPLRFPEESYEVSTPGEFWLEALYHLAGQTGEDRWRQTWQDLTKESDETRLRERALAQLLDFADEQKKKILLIVENMNMLFCDQLDDNDAWKLRHTLMHESRLMLLGTATNRFDGIEKTDRAFYELFKLHQLSPLTTEECNLVWERVAGKALDGEQIRPIHILTGGNLRLLTIIAKFGAQYSFRQLLDELVNLVDEHTEYFKSHLDSLAATERKVYLALANLWDPSSAREIAQAARMDVNKTSAFLKRLCEKGAVDILPKGKGRFYMLAERMYNIYYLMRRSGAGGRVKATINFMIGMYGEESAIQLLLSEVASFEAEDRGTIYKEMTSRFGIDGLEQPLQEWLDTIKTAISVGNEKEITATLEKIEQLLGSNPTSIATAYSNIVNVYQAVAVELAATGQPQEALRMIENSEVEKYLEPLVEGLRLYIGEDIRVAHEIYEVARDVKARIEKRRDEMQATVDGVI